MFERYTEKARRVVFFARYEASQFGSPYIETEHLLLGLMREDKTLTNRFLGPVSVEPIRKQIEGHTTVREKVSTSVDLPLSSESRRVLTYAAEEAERLSHKHIGTEHLLLGVLREEKCFATQILFEHGLRVATVRDELAKGGYASFDGGLQSSRAVAAVTIMSHPTGAEIEIDGAYFGSTPAELPLPVGERTVRLTQKGYAPWERTLQVLAGGKQTITAQLEPSTQ